MTRPREDSPLLVALALLLTLIAHAGPGLGASLDRLAGAPEVFSGADRDMPRIVIVEPDPVV